MSPIGNLLGRPAFHVLLGLFFFINFSWPFLAVKRPIHTWFYLHVGWALAIGVLFLIRRGKEDVEEEAAEEESAHD